jgi:hypothetical protein
MPNLHAGLLFDEVISEKIAMNLSATRGEAIENSGYRISRN